MIFVYYYFTIVLIILVIIVMVAIWKRKQKGRMLLTERIQRHDDDQNLHPEFMNNDMIGNLGDNLCVTVIQQHLYESFDEFPHNENSCDVLRGRTPSPLPMQSLTMALDPFNVKDKEDTISIQSKRSGDGDYIPMNATNPFLNIDGDVLDKENTTSIQSKRNDGDYIPMNATNPCLNIDGDVLDKEGTTSFKSESGDGDYIPMNATNPFQKMDGDVEEIHNEI